jgi:aquaporin Z
LLQLGLSVGNAPFNPARATASAVFSSSWSLEQLWLFWVAPLVGAGIAGLVFRGFAAGDATAAPLAEAALADGAEGDGIDRAEGLDETGTVDAVASGAVTPGAAGTAAAEVQARRDEAREFFDGKRG